MSTTTSDIAAGEWKNIQTTAHLKGRRRDPKYFPAIGETCRMSGPNCDDAEGYTWSEVKVLWSDDLFVVTRHKDCWPNVTKHELALFEPAACPLMIEARNGVASWLEVNPDKQAKGRWTPDMARSGQMDNDPSVSQYLAAIKRGMEIARAAPSQIEEG